MDPGDAAIIAEKCAKCKCFVVTRCVIVCVQPSLRNKQAVVSQVQTPGPTVVVHLQRRPASLGACGRRLGKADGHTCTARWRKCLWRQGGLPDYIHIVAADVGVCRQENQVFQPTLGNQQTIERVPMDHRQVIDVQGMAQLNRQD